jgi:ribosomal-protein-alanine N-acetyltransferase
VSGLAIEAATGRVEVLVLGPGGEERALETEDVGQGHTRRLTPLVRSALERAGVAPGSLAWVAADLGPGSFTGVRVGLATAEALALATGAEACGASSLAALAHSVPAHRSLIVPLVPAGRRDLFAGFFRADARGTIALVAAPRVGPVERVLLDVDETLPLLPRAAVRFVGPGVAREREALERARPGSTALAWRHEGLSARDLARAARAGIGPAAGLPGRGGPLVPLYVRSAQAEERVRHQVSAAEPVTLRPFTREDVPVVAGIERAVFGDPWPASFFHGELAQPLVYATIAEREGEIAGYQVSWLGAGIGHLGNLAVVPGRRRRGIARRLVDDLLAHAAQAGVPAVALEVRVSNFAAQALYRAFGFRLAGLRRGYYRDTGEDALVMEWRRPAAGFGA